MVYLEVGFFDVAAFYGGTVLSIFYGLDRFSEDLDFALPYCFSYDTEFYQKAFSCFYSRRFSEFKYDIEILYSDTIIDGREKKYYLLIGKVK